MDRDELAELVYLGSFDDPTSDRIFPFADLNPDGWKKRWYYRTADLILSRMEAQR